MSRWTILATFPLALALAPAASAAAQQHDSLSFTVAIAAKPRVPSRGEIEQRRRRVDYLDAYSLNPKAPFTGKLPPVWASTLLTSGDEQTVYLLVHRSASSVPEVHARWDDLVMIHSGDGAIVMGDSLVGSSYRAPGERRGGTFVKTRQIVVHAGDLVRIPAAVPHAFIVSGTTPLTYLVVKHRRQELPIRWFRDK